MAKKTSKKPVRLNKQLALFQFLLSKFGFGNFKDLQAFSDKVLDANVPETSAFYQDLSGKLNFPPDELRQFDTNLIAHLQQINTGKKAPIRLKYYQYFSLLFTEYYLNRYFAGKHELKDELNQFLQASRQPELKDLSLYTDEDLNKLAYWNATGSGKTFILHINILQYRHYAKQYGTAPKNLILLTPSQDLSEQHLADLEASNIPAHYYWEDKQSDDVKVIDIHKIKEYSSGQGVTIPLSEFDRNNAIFVDEGHKGNSKDDSTWRDIRTTLSQEGFAFEYSATFGQLSDESLLKEYGKCIVFDYSYGHFFDDGFGKDYWIHNLQDADLFAEQKQNQYLLQNLLLFVQQKIYYTTNLAELTAYEIENPLLIFVGSSVEPKQSKAQKEENTHVISDVKTVLDFFKDFLENRSKYLNWINALKKHAAEALFKEDYFSKLYFLFNQLPDAARIYEFCLKTVFNSNTAGELDLYTLRNATGEIGLKVRGADHYFALIYIGDTGTFKAPLEEKKEYEFRKDITSNSLFRSLSDKTSNPVNILIGARKFIEGWNNYRVSSIGLINFGKSKGSQIIQLFGRGVRLKGKEGSLKRSKNQPGGPQNIEIAETLNVFGLRAGYMKQFKEDLQKEGITTEKRQFTFEVKVTHDLSQLQLLTLTRDSTAARFETTDVIRLTAEPSVKVRIDISTKKFVHIGGRENISQHTNTTTYRLSEELLSLVDWDWIYKELLLFKKRMGSPQIPNLLITRNNLKQFVSGIDHQITADGHFVVKQLDDIAKLNKLTFQVLRQYVELFYKRHLRNYEGNNLTTQVLTSDNANIANAQWQVEVQTSDTNNQELQDIQNTLALLTDLTDVSTNYPEKLRTTHLIENTWLNAHLYQPLLKDESEQTLAAGSTKVIKSIKPPGLNKGEFTFVEHLRSFIASNQSRYPDLDFYLLRNLSRGTGFGFYFVSGGFYPDFMLWIKNKQTGKQYLTFIDPHGLRNEGSWESPKIANYRTIKELEAKLGNPDLVLNSFILQPPPHNLEQTGLNNWHRADDALRQIPLNDYAAARNVLAIPTDGNKSGVGGYLDLIVQKIIA